MKRLGLVLGAVVLFAAGAAFYAQARTHVETSAGLTGCFKVTGEDDGGHLSHLALGDKPAKACKKNEVVVHLGSGDISAVNAGTGLQGGATTGAATLAVAPSYRLPQGCAGDSVPQWGTAAWACALFDGSDFALSGQACPSGQFAQAISATGSLTCASPGAGIIVTTLAAGDATCPDGGLSVKVQEQTSFVCNGARGPQGAQGPAGEQGPPGGASSASLMSPNGVNGITINDNGVYIHFRRGTQFYAANGSGSNPSPYYGR